MNKLVKMLTVSSATLMGVVGLSQLAPVHAADTTAKSVGTLAITDGTQTLTSVDDIDFGSIAYDANGMKATLENPNEKKATVKDTTFSQTAWTISGQTDSDVADLTINGQLLSATPAAVFTKTADAKFGEQTATVENATMALSADQATKNGTKAISMDVNWTLAPTTRSANFN
ncbi:hypothetical protein ACBP45_10040 [Latilactobacillus sakei]|nr:hypothetical protein [Latilactobacillus sakei]